MQANRTQAAEDRGLMTDLWGHRFEEVEAMLSELGSQRNDPLRVRWAKTKRRRRALERRLRQAAHGAKCDWGDVRGDLIGLARDFRLFGTEVERRLRRAREEQLTRFRADAERWSLHVDRLHDAFRRSDESPPTLKPKLEELRHKRNTLLTKVEALRRHEISGWRRARKEFSEAHRALRETWRSVLAILDRESLLV